MIILALAGILTSTQMPLFGALLMTFAGIPALLVLFTWGLSWFVTYSIVTMIVTGVIDLSAALMILPAVFFPAFALFKAYKSSKQPLEAVGLALMATTIFSAILIIVAFSVTSDGDPFRLEEVFAQQQASLEETYERMEKSGVESSTIELFRRNVQETVNYLRMIMPFISFFVWHIITIAILYVGAMYIAPDIKLRKLPSFGQWRFNWNIIWLFIAGWFFYHVIGRSESFPAADVFLIVGANLSAASKIIYFIAGLSLLTYMFDKYNLRSISRACLYLFAFMFNQALVWFAIIDIWADFRTEKPALFSSKNDGSDGDV